MAEDRPVDLVQIGVLRNEQGVIMFHVAADDAISAQSLLVEKHPELDVSGIVWCGQLGRKLANALELQDRQVVEWQLGTEFKFPA
jgi:hypothetical protein